MSNRGAWAEINLSALRHNISVIKSRVTNGAKFCAVVKADAYGHGAVAVAREAVAQGADYLAVAVLSEAVKLREAGFTTPILILGPTQPQEADIVVRYRITQAVFTVEQAAALAAAALRQHTHAKVHIAVDTGMGRIGVRPGNAGEIAAAIKKILTDDKLRETFKKKSLEVAKEDDFETTLDKFINIYSKVVKG